RNAVRGTRDCLLRDVERFRIPKNQRKAFLHFRIAQRPPKAAERLLFTIHEHASCNELAYNPPRQAHQD
ncbi:unnamed protein product, partial [Amoebophrya sp. A25]